MVITSGSSERAGLTVRRLGADDDLWRVIDGDTRFSLYSGSAWRAVMEEVFGFRPRTMTALRNGEIVDLLPAYEVRMPLLGSKLISTPMEGCYGGFVSSDREAHELLIQSAIEYANERDASHIEIRSGRPMEMLRERSFTESRPFLISQVALHDESANWKMLSANHRRNVRISERRGVVIRSGRSLGEMRTFHRLISRHYKQLGVPFPGPVYFDAIWRLLLEPGRAELHVAEVEDRMVGGHLMLLSGSTLVSKYSAALQESEFKGFNISYALFWEAIRYGLSLGLDSFNMGITGMGNTGLIDFKSRFGAETSSLHFYFFNRRGQPPEFSKFLDGYRTAKAVWRLSPSFVTGPLGQLINRWIC